MLNEDLLLHDKSCVRQDYIDRLRIQNLLCPEILNDIALKHLDGIVPPVLPLRDSHISLLVLLDSQYDHYVLVFSRLVLERRRGSCNPQFIGLPAHPHIFLQDQQSLKIQVQLVEVEDQDASRVFRVEEGL